MTFPPKAETKVENGESNVPPVVGANRRQNPMDTNVKELLDKAAKATEAHNAMNFAQAALNAAHALQVLKQIEVK